MTCSTCKGNTYTYRCQRLQNGDSRRSPMPCAECQRGAYRLTAHIDAVPGRCGGRPCLTGTRFDVAHVITYLKHETPEQMAADWSHLPLEAFQHVARIVATGNVPAWFWEETYDPTDVRFASVCQELALLTEEAVR